MIEGLVIASLLLSANSKEFKKLRHHLDVAEGTLLPHIEWNPDSSEVPNQSLLEDNTKHLD